VASGEKLTDEDLIVESVFLGLRSEGIDLRRLRSTYGVDLFLEAEPCLASFLRERLLVNEDGRLRLTPKGYPLCDHISGALLEHRRHS